VTRLAGRAKNGVFFFRFSPRDSGSDAAAMIQLECHGWARHAPAASGSARSAEMTMGACAPAIVARSKGAACGADAVSVRR